MLALQLDSPQLLKGPVDALLQTLLHGFNKLRLLPQLLLHRVEDQLVAPPALPQRQALLGDLQRDGGGGQRQLALLLGLGNAAEP